MDAPIRSHVGHAIERGFRLDELLIEPVTGEVSGPGGAEKLDPKVMGVLLMLARNAGLVVSREDLHEQLWPSAVVTDDALTRCIHELRRQLSQAGGSERYRILIETLPKRGYRLNGKVTPLAQCAATDLPAPSSRKRLAFVAAVAAAVLLAAFAALWLLRPTSDPPSRTAAAPKRSIAVLPFVDMTEGQDQTYFSDGIAEEILNRLAQSGDLTVIARTSSFTFRDQSLDIPEIAARLNVSHVLEGSVRRSGSRVRITTQLIETSTNSHLWSETFDRELDDLFAVQDEIASAAALALNVTLADEPRHVPPAPDPDAYEKFLQGEHFYKRRGPGDIDRSVRFYEKAVEIDPRFARGWAALSGAYSLMWLEAGHDPVEWLARQGEAAHKAVELDPGLAIAHARLARYYYHQNDRRRGDEHFHRALALDPDEPLIMAAAVNWAFDRGKPDEALATQRRLAERDPLSFVQRANLGHVLLAVSQLDEALSEFQFALDLNPTDLALQCLIGRILVVQGRHDEAAAVIDNLPEGSIRDLGLAMLYEALGRRADADLVLGRLAAEPGDSHRTIAVAGVYAFRGMNEEAIALLHDLRSKTAHAGPQSATRLWGLVRLMRGSYFLKPLHADPHWSTLAAYPD